MNNVWIEPAKENFALANDTDLPRWLFHCCLDDQPDHLVPEHSLRDWAWEAPSDRPLFINHNAWFAPNGDLPTALADRDWLLDNFALAPNMIWINDPVRKAVWPFWLGHEFGVALAGLQPGDRLPATLSSQARRVLAMAGVVVSGDYAATNNRLWSNTFSHCAAHFKEKRYAPIGHLIHPFHLSSLRRYYRHLIRTGRITLGDSQSARRYAMQNEAVARFFHHQLTASVSRVIAEPVKPSYVYFGSYQGGAELEAHIDREQCEFTVSLCIDYSPEPVRATPWPLQLHTPGGKTIVYQGLGDALIYRGCELPHSRDPLPHGNTSTSLFFHYVRESFTGKLT